ncbi:hypothetical protein WL83_04080 [Burkholderia ubonensis]|nr:hypothetical protein WL83_04080 [Burkholderia ubonensis]
MLLVGIRGSMYFAESVINSLIFECYGRCLGIAINFQMMIWCNKVGIILLREPALLELSPE